MATRWLLNGHPLTKNQIANAAHWGISRANLLLSSLYVDPPSGNAMRTDVMNFFDLLDQSEKTSVSYLVGCALANLSGPAAIRQRAGKHIVGRLFHASLLKSHTHLFNTMHIATSNGARPDFLGFDETDRIHVFEAKGDMSSNGHTRIAEGLQQVAGVQGIEFPDPHPVMTIAPASLNVCLAYRAKKAADWCPTPGALAIPVPEGIRNEVFHIDHLPAEHNHSPDRSKSLQMQLAGIYSLGMWLTIQGAHCTDHLDKPWLVYEFPDGQEYFRVLLPRRLVNGWNEIVEPLLDEELLRALEYNQLREDGDDTVRGRLQDVLEGLGNLTLQEDISAVKDERNAAQIRKAFPGAEPSVSDAWLWLV